MFELIDITSKVTLNTPTAISRVMFISNTHDGIVFETKSSKLVFIGMNEIESIIQITKEHHLAHLLTMK